MAFILTDRKEKNQSCGVAEGCGKLQRSMTGDLVCSWLSTCEMAFQSASQRCGQERIRNFTRQYFFSRNLVLYRRGYFSLLIQQAGGGVMRDDSEVEMDEDYPEEKAYTPRKMGGDSNGNRLIPIFIGIIAVLILGGAVFYFVYGRSARADADQLKAKMTAFEQKIASLERQITDMQGKMTTVGQDPLLLQRLDALSQKVEAMESRPRTTVETKPKPAPSKPMVSAEKKYHTVQKGETLTRISKEYGISVSKLRKINNLSADQSVKTGQKLLVSP
jgi:LysM repeat protein